ncbi:MAG: Lpg1974 family pore-forming outer membrane protein [Pirellulales bacterium]|nr:Lpg1974 family pore-forming outer membrane protein [Pirellulales bacterium]
MSAQKTLNTDGNAGWIVQGDYLYWTMRSPGVEYGVTDIGGVQDRGAVGTVLALNGDYSGGVRFALGKRVGGNNAGPELLFTYTDFDSAQTETHTGSLRATFISSDNSENDDSDNINTLGFETVTPDDRATSVTANSQFDYQIYDIEIGQSLILSDALTLRLSGGGRAALIDDDFSVTYAGGDFQVPFRSFKETDYKGGGFVVGSDLRWYLCPSLRLDFATSLGLLLGRIETRTFIPDDEPGVPTDVRHNETRMTPVLEMAMGLNSQRQIGRFNTNLGLGYEMTNWFNMEDSRVFTDSRMEAQNAHLIRDLSLDGLYARFTINH